VELTYQLAEQLIALEQQAAQCAALLDGAPPEVLAEVLTAFAPMPALKITNAKQRETWGKTWIAWVMDAGARWEARPPDHPDGEVMADLLLKWVLR